MSSGKITVLTEGGRVFGLGHIARCLSICQYFEELDLVSEFIIEGDDSVLSALEGRSFTLMNWLNNVTVLQRLEDSAFVLVDSLRLTEVQMKSLQNIDAHIIYIDDDRRTNFLDHGFVVDWTVLSDQKKYFFPRKEDVIYLLGSQYTPLRSAFVGVDKINIKENVKNVLISFGGSDVRNLTPEVLKVMKLHFPELKKRVVVGHGFENINKIKLFQDNNTTLIYSANAEQMSLLMQDSDIAISGGGQTLYELASLGVPTIAPLLVENARDDTEGWAKVGAVDYIGHFDDKDLMEKLILSVKKISNQKVRQKMQLNGSAFIGTDGGRLILNAVINKAK